MKIKTQIDNVADIPESLKDYYVEKGGKWSLDFDGVKQTDEFKSVWNEVLSLRKEKSDLASKVDVFGELTPEAVKAMQDRVKELEAAASASTDVNEVQKRAEEIAAIRAKPLMQQLEEWKVKHDTAAKERDSVKSTLTKKELESRIRKLTDGKIKPKCFEDVLNSAQLDGLKYIPEADEFVHEASSMPLPEWFEKKMENREWGIESQGGGASGGRGGKGNGGPATWLDVLNNN